MDTNEAFKLAQQRGYTTTAKNPSKAFREACKKDPDKYETDYGLKFVEFEAGVNKYRFFDTKTHT